jgi:hypothetical protein
MIWVTREVKPFRAAAKVGNGGVLFRLGNPTNWSFWREGRRATRAEIDAAVVRGLPQLEELARIDGPGGLAELAAMKLKFEPLLPPHPK